jgi:hypothetical protein
MGVIGDAAGGPRSPLIESIRETDCEEAAHDRRISTCRVMHMAFSFRLAPMHAVGLFFLPGQLYRCISYTSLT